MPKLTLSADKEVIEKAKRLAEERGTSVSALFSRFIESLSSDPNGKRKRTAPLTRKATGLVKLPDDKTDRELIESALAQRHGK